MTVASNTVIGTLPGGTEVVATSLEAGRELLTTVDDYLSQQSPFDRQARVNLRRQVVEVTLPMYLDYIASQVMSWSQTEIKALGAIVSAMAKLFAPLSLRLPAEIHLVKTSGQEEGYAAYTRRKDTIVLPANMVASVETATSYGDPLHPTNDVSYLQNVMIRECFHLFSKNHPEERFKLYDRIHYRSTGAAVLLANRPYDGGVFFEYLKWWFMSIAEGPDRRWAPVLGPDGYPVMYESAPLMPEYLALVTANFTQEIFQPDEILAQNFVLAANQPSLDILSFMNQTLSANRGSS
jgi:hypothetical protein